MSWRDRLDPELRGSFRGVDFHVASADTQGGRRWLVHEYPRRDRPYSEDMGRRAKEWRLELFVAGDDYDQQRDALIEALDAPGAATLVHPYLGTFSAVATDVRWRESTRDGGVCTFQVTFAESGEEAYPVTTLDTRRELSLAADAAETSLLEDFSDQWSVQGLQGWSLVAVERDLLAVFGDLENMVGDITDEITDVIRAHERLAETVMGGYDRLRHAVMRPLTALDLYSGNSLLGSPATDGAGRVRLSPGTPVRAARVLRELGTSGRDVEIPVADTPERRQRGRNTIAAQRLSGRAAAVTAARLVAETDWLSRQDAEAAGHEVLALIDDLTIAQGDASIDASGGESTGAATAREPISDAVYAALVALRVAVSEDLRTRATALPGLTTHTPQVITPALVLAHRLYGDATRADEIAVRNNVQRPGALRGGMTLEVLSD